MSEQTPCSHCGQNIARYKSVFNHILLSAALKAYRHAKAQNTTIIHVKQLGLTNSEYTGIAELVLFGLLFKQKGMKRGEFGVPLDRIWRFWTGEVSVAAYLWRSPMKVKGKPSFEASKERIMVGKIPKIEDIITKYGETMTEYEAWK